MVEAAIEVKNLCKRYGSIEAVAGVDLSVASGELLAFLGPNGAGKTTTVEILEGLRTRTAGEVRVLGVDPAEATAAWRERIGVVLQGPKHEGDFTAAEIVTMWSAYYRSPRRTAELLELVGLAPAARTRARRLSGGQQHRLAVALALVGDPELVFLDEPTTGFDPAARREAWQTIGGLRSLGVTVMLTTHYMDEADFLADRIAVITRGQIVANGTSPELAAQAALPVHISWDAAELDPAVLGGRLSGLLSPDAEPVAAAATAATAGATSVEAAAAGATSVDAEAAAAASAAHPSRHRARPTLATRDVGPVVRELLHTAEANGSPLNSLAVLPPTLEDAYLALTGPDSEDLGAAGPDSEDLGADGPDSEDLGAAGPDPAGPDPAGPDPAGPDPAPAAGAKTCGRASRRRGRRRR